MKTYKTNTANRTTYTYKFYDQDGNKEKITIRPGENGVTEANIKELHALDDSEVYYNNKNLRPERTEEEKAEMKRWEEDYINNAIKERGYTPTKDEVKDAVKEKFPRNYNLSLDFIYGDSESETDFDKNNLMYQASLAAETEESDETLKVRKLMSQMTEKQREALILTEFKGWGLKEAGKIMGISAKNVKKHRDNAMKYIEENYK